MVYMCEIVTDTQRTVIVLEAEEVGREGAIIANRYRIWGRLTNALRLASDCGHTVL